MSGHFRVHRLGHDEFALGHLINGSFPDDDERQRLRLMEAVCWHIERLWAEHREAWRVLGACRERGDPFVLFLRSFAVEQRGHRVGGEVVSQLDMGSQTLQSALATRLQRWGVPVVKLHGGSDPMHASFGGDPVAVLTTHDDNWLAVADDLIRSAAAIVFLLGADSPGVAREFERIEAAGADGRCLLVCMPGARPPAWARHRFEAAGDDDLPAGLSAALQRCLDAPPPRPCLDLALEAPFHYLERPWLATAERARQAAWLQDALRLLHTVLDPAYWALLQAHDVPLNGLDLGGAWKRLHQVFGVAVASGDFGAVDDALALLQSLDAEQGRRDGAAVCEALRTRFRALAAACGAEPPAGEGRAGREPPASLAGALRQVQAAEQARAAGDPDAALVHWQAALVTLRRAPDATPDEADAYGAHICRDWGQALWRAGQAAWALVNLELAVALARQLQARDPVAHAAMLPLNLSAQGSLRHQAGDLDGAERSYREALALRRTLAAADDDEAGRLGLVLANLGRLMLDRGEPARALTLLEEALSLPIGSEPRARARAWLAEARG